MCSSPKKTWWRHSMQSQTPVTTPCWRSQSCKCDSGHRPDPRITRESRHRQDPPGMVKSPEKPPRNSHRRPKRQRPQHRLRRLSRASLHPAPTPDRFAASPSPRQGVRSPPARERTVFPPRRKSRSSKSSLKGANSSRNISDGNGRTEKYALVNTLIMICLIA